MAIELYLKAFNPRFQYDDLDGTCGYTVTVKAVRRGHFPVELFDVLDPALRQELDEAYARDPVSGGKPTLREEREVYDDLFEYSRYPFEPEWPDDRPGTPINRLLDLTKFLGRSSTERDRGTCTRTGAWCFAGTDGLRTAPTGPDCLARILRAPPRYGLRPRRG